MSNELPTVILNLVQDLTEDWEIKARGEMLKQVQHDNIATIKTQNPTRKVGFCASKDLFLPLKMPFLGLFGVFLQGFTKTQNLMLLNISVLQSKLCVFAFLCFAFCILFPLNAWIMEIFYYLCSRNGG